MIKLRICHNSEEAQLPAAPKEPIDIQTAEPFFEFLINLSDTEKKRFFDHSKYEACGGALHGLKQSSNEAPVTLTIQNINKEIVAQITLTLFSGEGVNSHPNDRLVIGIGQPSHIIYTLPENGIIEPIHGQRTPFQIWINDIKQHQELQNLFSTQQKHIDR